MGVMHDIPLVGLLCSVPFVLIALIRAWLRPTPLWIRLSWTFILLIPVSFLLAAFVRSRHPH